MTKDLLLVSSVALLLWNQLHGKLWIYLMQCRPEERHIVSHLFRYFSWETGKKKELFSFSYVGPATSSHKPLCCSISAGRTCVEHPGYDQIIVKCLLGGMLVSSSKQAPRLWKQCVTFSATIPISPDRFLTADACRPCVDSSCDYFPSTAEWHSSTCFPQVLGTARNQSWIADSNAAPGCHVVNWLASWLQVLYRNPTLPFICVFERLITKARSTLGFGLAKNGTRCLSTESCWV